MTARESDAAIIRAMLLMDHERIRELVEDMRRVVQCDDWADCDRTWEALEHVTLAHIAFEEERFFPLFAEYPELIEPDVPTPAALKAEHDAMRERLAEIGLGIELHEMRAPVIDAFLDHLVEHGRTEERWADAIAAAVHERPQAARGFMERVQALFGSRRDGDRHAASP